MASRLHKAFHTPHAREAFCDGEHIRRVKMGGFPHISHERLIPSKTIQLITLILMHHPPLTPNKAGTPSLLRELPQTNSWQRYSGHQGVLRTQIQIRGRCAVNWSLVFAIKDCFIIRYMLGIYF